MKRYTFKFKGSSDVGDHVVFAENLHKAKNKMADKLGHPLGPRHWYTIEIDNKYHLIRPAFPRR